MNVSQTGAKGNSLKYSRDLLPIFFLVFLYGLVVGRHFPPIARADLNFSLSSFLIAYHFHCLFILNFVGVYLVAKELLRHQYSVLFALAVYAFSGYATLGLHSDDIALAITGPLYFLFALIRYEKQRSCWNLGLLAVISAMALLQANTLHLISSVYWGGLFALLICLFRRNLVTDLFKQLKRRQWILVLFILWCFLAITKIGWLIHKVSLGQLPSGTLRSVSFVNNTVPSLKTLVGNWVPVFDPNDRWFRSNPKNAYLYIGLGTIPLLVCAFFLSFRNLYGLVFILSYLGGHLVLWWFASPKAHAAYIEGGGSLMLVFAAAIGLDLLFGAARLGSSKTWFHRQGARALNIALPLLLIAGLVVAMTPLFNHLGTGARIHSCAYIGIWLSLYCLVAWGSFLCTEYRARRLVFQVWMVLTFSDLILPLGMVIPK